jgi:hypothetical protein
VVVMTVATAVIILGLGGLLDHRHPGVSDYSRCRLV